MPAAPPQAETGRDTLAGSISSLSAAVLRQRDDLRHDHSVFAEIARYSGRFRPYPYLQSLASLLHICPASA